MGTGAVATRDEQGMQYGYVGHITKWEELDDGTLYVYGKAAGPDLDLDGQCMDPAWLKTALPKWYEWANVREQHANIAAGVGVELTERGDDWFLKAHVVDAGTVKKVKNKVLKGFSGGIVNGQVIRSDKAPNGMITGGDIAEISLVDRPSNPGCSLAIAKSAGGGILLPVEVSEMDSEIPETVAAATPDSSGDVVDRAKSIIEKSAAWYRIALRTVEDAHAGKFLSAVPFITKAAAPASADEIADVAAAHKACDLVLDLIISEAQQAKGGNYKELRDIEVLLSAASALERFTCMEHEELTDHDLHEMPYGAGDYLDGDKAYLTKAFGPAWASDDDPADPAEPVEPATIDASTDMITKAVAAREAELTAAHEAELATLRADLEKAQRTPLPGGPVTFKHVKPTSTAPVHAALSEADPAYWRAKAAAPGLSPVVVRSYIAKAASLEQGASST